MIYLVKIIFENGVVKETKLGAFNAEHAKEQVYARYPNIKRCEAYVP